MDIEKLKLEHPALFAEAVALGKKAESERVRAHLSLGEASGDMALATKSIADGRELDSTMQAEYLAANMRKNATEARSEEDPKVAPKITESAEDSFWDGVK